MGLFKKAAVFGDLHLGLKSNSVAHNQDCEDYIDWFIAKAKAEGCDTGLFLGDFHHNRNTLNIVTMNYSLRILEKLGKAFDQFFFFPGNHDLFYRDRRDVHSVEFGRHIPGITIVDKPTTIGDVTLCPWLIGEEWKKVSGKGGRYIFGHFELPHFFMNSMVQLPDHGELQLDNFKNYEMGFSGHFHKRQTQANMHYIGNAFPHNYSDTWDDERGMMILEWGGEPQYHTWDNQPTFRTLKLSQLLDKLDALKSNQHWRVSVDVDISFEESSYIKEKFMNDYNLRELMLIPARTSIEINTDMNIQAFESIDAIVANQIASIDSESFNKNTLLAIYNSI